MARYRKVDPRIWNDAKFRELSDDGKLLFFFLLTHPHQTALGAMRATIDGLAMELQWSPKAFREAFYEVSMKGMAKADEKASMIWLPKFLRYNGPESPNVVKAWESALDLIPECDLKTEAIQAAKDYLQGLSEAYLKAFPEALDETLAQACLNPEPEQEPEQEKTNSGEPSPGSPPSPEPAKEAAPLNDEDVFIYLPTKRVQTHGEYYSVPIAHVQQWESDYPGLNVRQELIKARNWLDTRPPGEKKTYRGMNKFVVNWLNRAFDRPQTGGQSGPSSPEPRNRASQREL